MNVTEARTVVVGVDGSPSSDAALDWAVDEAVRRGLRLELLHTSSTRSLTAAPGGGAPPLTDDDGDGTVLSSAARRVREAAPGLEVVTSSSRTDPASALLERSHGAALLVVGTHGRNLISRFLLGSVSHRVAAHAHCPVVVVHQEVGARDLPVVVGIDGSSGSDAALAVAVDEARQRKVALIVVHGWQPAPTVSYDMLPVSQEVVDAEHDVATSVVESAVAAVRELAPELEVISVLSPTGPVMVLDEESDNAQLLVVGTHGHRGFSTVAFGSVTSAVVDGARCPVMVVPAPSAPA